MSSLNNTTEQLLALRALTRTTGCLHEAQLLQLKVWPYLLYPKIDLKYELRIDQDAKTAQYLLQFPKSPPKSLAKRLEALEQDFQWLLGPEWLLMASANSKPVFKGRRRVKAAANADKKAYTPFINAINDYINREWSGKNE